MKSGRSRGKTWDRKSTSIVPSPEWREGKAPKTIGEAVKPEVYKSMPKSSSIALKPAGEPCIE